MTAAGQPGAPTGTGGRVLRRGRSVTALRTCPVRPPPAREGTADTEAQRGRTALPPNALGALIATYNDSTVTVWLRYWLRSQDHAREQMVSHLQQYNAGQP